MAQLTNYIPDTNRFRLAGPPEWFLKELFHFDDSLVVFPSRQGYYYRLAQRRKPQLSASVVNEVLKEEADTKMLASYGCVPVTTILATANWSNPYLFEELRRRAPWRLGGAEHVHKRLLQEEREDNLKRRQEMDENNEYLAKDAWKYYQLKKGLRSSLISSPDNKAPVRQGLLKDGAKKPYKPTLYTAWGNPYT